MNKEILHKSILLFLTLILVVAVPWTNLFAQENSTTNSSINYTIIINNTYIYNNTYTYNYSYNYTFNYSYNYTINYTYVNITNVTYTNYTCYNCTNNTYITNSGSGIPRDEFQKRIDEINLKFEAYLLKADYKAPLFGSSGNNTEPMEWRSVDTFFTIGLIISILAALFAIGLIIYMMRG